jgi:asparagine synthetase B (glutamine-hydrolysing)
MCGIFSYLGKNFSFAELVALSNKIKHRGPDSSNNVSLYFNDKQFFLGFHRLAINGLDEISNQPLMDNDNEIYFYNKEIKLNRHEEHLLFKTSLNVQKIIRQNTLLELSRLEKINKICYS